MMRLVGLFAIATVSACSAPAEPPVAPPQPAPALPVVKTAVDDGRYLEQIDPLGGQWRIERIGDEDFARFKAWANFSAGGFINHGAGCSGGYPAFYRIEGDRLTVIRREAVQTGKCAAATPAHRKAAVASERRLAAFLDQVAAWSRPDDRTLILTGKDGARAVLTRPLEPHPEIAGRWLIDSIGGQPLATERRPATVTIGMNSIGASADCNSMGSEFTVPAPGRIVVGGPIVSTAIGCPPEDQAEDDLMARAIRGSTAFRLEGERLVFTGNPGMILRRPPPANRQLPGRYAACGDTLLGAYHEGPVTLAIDQDTMRDNAGCAARYQAEGPRLTLRVENSLACADKAPPYTPGEPVGIGGDISLLAVAPPDGFGFNDQGQLVLRTNRGLLRMCREGSPPPFGR